MPSLASLLLYICAYIFLIIMIEAVDSSYHAQFDTIVDPGQDLELEPMNATDLQASDSVSLLSERLTYSAAMHCDRTYVH
jgi:hypothetical protein